MQKINAVISFADDYREEKNNRISMIGLMPTRVLCDTFPLVLTKLVVILSFSIHGYEEITLVFKVKIVDQDEKIIFSGNLNLELGESEKDVVSSSPINALHSQIALGMVKIEKPGYLHITIEHEVELISEAVIFFEEKSKED